MKVEENKKFRNHFSIVFEQMGAGFWVFVSVFFFEFLSDPEFIADVETLEASGKELIIGSGIIVIVIAILVGIQTIIWSKTYISIQGNTLIVERNTIKKKKNTIGIQNISNINTEQNLFEMLMGTCKVKLDTNSMSTADSTDVKIVLKKADAENFKLYLQNIAGKDNGQRCEETEKFIQETANDAERMLMHGLFSINGIAVIFLIGCIIGIGKSLGNFSGSLISALSSILVMFVFALSITKDIIDGFIKYYGFQVKRNEDKIYINYGLLKKVNYVIPVDKINGVKLIQSPQARIAGWYTVQIINVGVGDEEQEEQSFLLLYEKKEGIVQKIERLLPEFSGCVTQEIPRQPRKVWYVWMLPIIGYIGGAILIIAIGLEFWSEHFLWFILVAVVVSFLVIMEFVGRYMTAGSVIGDKMLSITQGCLGKTALFVKYPKIQYLEVKQNFLAKKLHLQKADIYLLASTQNRCQSIPYFYEEEVEILKGYICNK